MDGQVSAVRNLDSPPSGFLSLLLLESQMAGTQCLSTAWTQASFGPSQPLLQARVGGRGPESLDWFLAATSTNLSSLNKSGGRGNWLAAFSLVRCREGHKWFSDPSSVTALQALCLH